MRFPFTAFLAAAAALGLSASLHSPAAAHDHTPEARGEVTVKGDASETARETGEEPRKFDFPEAGTTRLVGEEETASMLKTHGSEMLVVNFWATWCGPCVEEMPYFVKLSEELEDEKVRIAGISVDFHNQVDDVVIPFLQRREIPYSNVVYSGDPEAVIDMFSEEWAGAIPATFFLDREGNKLGEVLEAVTEEELRELVDKHYAMVTEAAEAEEVASSE